MSDYPKREKFFAHRFIRAITKDAVANELGSDVCWFLTVVALQEDAKRYRGPVTWYSHQLLPLCGLRTDKQLARIRAKAIDAGFLSYEAGGKGTPGKYWVTIPDYLKDVDDGPCDESGEERRKNGGRSGRETAEEGAAQREREGKTSGEGREREGKGKGELTNLFPIPIPLPSAQADAAGERALSEQIQRALAFGVHRAKRIVTATVSRAGIDCVRLALDHYGKHAASRRWNFYTLIGWLEAADANTKPTDGWGDVNASKAEETESLESRYGPELDAMPLPDVEALFPHLPPAPRQIGETAPENARTNKPCRNALLKHLSQAPPTKAE